ncbi:ATP-binding protein [Emticicia sp. SJ17W-69]|uniref:sensor histidine kinase n=1 Tax=Emticicia sp. SJ17W-69 TaxID=3421657 RepID=UPI003EBC793E
MKIVDKQTIRVPLILSFALIIFSINIYLFFSYFRENEFYAYLQSTGINRSKMLFDEGISAEHFNSIDVDLKESPYLQEHYIIYDSTGNVIYKSKYSVPHLNEKLKQTVLKAKITAQKDGFERIIFANKENKKHRTFIIEASGYDLAGFDKQEKLFINLIISNVILITLMVFISRFYIWKDLKPVGVISKRMRSITTKNLQQRIPEANLDNEIGEMAHTFNDLLDRLDASYSQQRNFVSYATHELRTPLAILLGNTQVALMKTRSAEEYISTLKNFEQDINSMVNLISGLLELARMNADSQSIPFADVRIDELLWQTENMIKSKTPMYKINIIFEEIPENDESLIVNGNAELLILVFRNLIENGCKYSENNKVDVKINFDKNKILLDFADEGVGIPLNEIEHIFEPFYRTQKTKAISGHGIGLPLTKRIVDLHGGEILVNSTENVGTTFTVIFTNKSRIN